MADTHGAKDLISTLLMVTETSIVPLTREKVASGSKLFGAAILTKSSLAPVTVATNNELASPLLHGEINCIQTFFASPKEGRPATKDCIFFATHEPCSLCLSGITWSGFNEFYYLFTYEDSRDLFGIPCEYYCIETILHLYQVPAEIDQACGTNSDDIDILQSVYQVASPSDTSESLATKPLYNRSNKFFTARSVADLVATLEDESEKIKWMAEVERIKTMYNALSDTYQKAKAMGQETSSIFR